MTLQGFLSLCLFVGNWKMWKWCKRYRKFPKHSINCVDRGSIFYLHSIFSIPLVKIWIRINISNLLMTVNISETFLKLAEICIWSRNQIKDSVLSLVTFLRYIIVQFYKGLKTKGTSTRSILYSLYIKCRAAFNIFYLLS